MVKTKFPSLYTIVKNGDVETLSRFYDVYPETSATCQLAFGKKLDLIEQALVLKQVEIVNFLIDKTPLDKLSGLIPYLISGMKCNNNESGNPNFNYYLERIFNQIELTGSEPLKKLLDSLLVKLCTCGIAIHNQIILNLMNNRVFDLKTRLTQNDQFKWEFESEIILKAPLRVYQLMIQYYQANQIPLEQLLAHYLLNDIGNFNKTVKLFKSVDLKTPVKISVNPDVRVQLSTLFVASGAQAKLSDLLANPNFDTELIEVIKFTKLYRYFYSSNFKLKTLVGAYRREQSLLTNVQLDSDRYIDVREIVSDELMGYLKLFESKLPNTFWDFILRLNNLCTNSKNKEKGNQLIIQMIK